MGTIVSAHEGHFTGISKRSQAKAFIRIGKPSGCRRDAIAIQYPAGCELGKSEEDGMNLRQIMALLGLAGFAFTALPAIAHTESRDYPIRPVEFTRVALDDAFWQPRIETNRRVTIPHAMRMIEETGRVDNFRKAARMMKGPFRGSRYDDSDVFKVMEGAAYSLRLQPDPILHGKLRDLIRIIASAQEADGYLYTARTIDPAHPGPGAGPERWSLLRNSHELYNVGHMYEAAVAYWQATGEKDFLDIAYKNAALLMKVFGPGRMRAFPGHQEIEIGLAKLYRASQDSRYLDLAKFFLDQRGRSLPLHDLPPDSPYLISNRREYLQDHLPVLEQTEAVGHAVRAVYMYSGMADVASLGGYSDYVKAIDALWENVVGKKLYLTGGIGAIGEGESFGPDYDLPNAEAYAETCAAIGNALWNQRLFLLHGDSRYVDVLERILYNGMISGVSLSGDLFFYENPLESSGKYERSPWFTCACCPGNIVRFLPSVPGYVYATGSDSLYVNLFINGKATVDVAGSPVSVRQETPYPWDGRVSIILDPKVKRVWTLRLRVPGWALGRPLPSDLYHYLDSSADPVSLKVNGRSIPLEMDQGYARVSRSWRAGDRIEMNLPMPVRRVIANGAVAADRGKIALERGPIVFCAEGIDNGGRTRGIVVADDAELKSDFRSQLLGGVAVIHGKSPASGRETEFLAVPYSVWAHRGAGEMTVWFPHTPPVVPGRNPIQ
jgi:DUF1680 family protein